ncbi:hypothetical protein D3C78_516350 [compost metagenome]
MLEAMHQHLQRGTAHAPHLRTDDHELAGYRLDIVPGSVVERAALLEVDLASAAVEENR